MTLRSWIPGFRRGDACVYDELITAILIADFAATAAGSYAVWRKIDHIDRRLVKIETEHHIFTNRPGGPHAGEQGGGHA